MSGESADIEHKVFNEGIIVIFAMLMLFMLYEAFKHKNHWKFGHEASFVVIVGIVISGFYTGGEGSDEFADIMEFNDDLFFYFVLPPIIFAAGYNMYRKKFFQNIANISLFGVLGTFLTFGCFAGITVTILSNFELGTMAYDSETGEWKYDIVKLTMMEILLMCSLLCATDVIAAVSLLNPRKQPKLFSLVFGEGIVNDAVCIILFNTVNDFAKDSDEVFDAKSVGIISLEFVMLGIVSILIGSVFGLSQSYLMKKVRSLTRDPVAECAIIFAVAYISYVVAELLHQSGIIALLFSGIVMAHYGWYNLSPQGQTTSSVVFQFLGFIAEGFVFCYLGLTFFSYRAMPFSPSLVGILLVVIVFCRFVATIGLVSLLKLCRYESKHPNPLNYRELIFIWYSGLIRGAIAFGLVLRIENSFAGRNLIVTTCLSLVLISTIVFGSTVGLVSSCLFGDVKHQLSKEGDKEEDDLLENDGEGQEDEDSDLSDRDQGSSDSSSVRSGFQGPNSRPIPESQYSGSLVNSGVDGYQRAASGSQVRRSDASGSNKDRKQKRKSCGSYLQRFDEFCMKPIFIRKYNAKKAHMAEAFVYDYIEKGEKTEKQFISGASSGGGRYSVQKTHVDSSRRFDGSRASQEM